MRKKKALGNRHQALGEDTGNGDLRARVVGLDKKIHALAKGATGLTAEFFPNGSPGLRIVTLAQEYAIEFDANWVPRGVRAKAPKWRRLAEAKDALMHAALVGVPDLIKAWKVVIEKHAGSDSAKAAARMDEIEELLKV